MKIAIHQPNFFPHLNFFKKMEMADYFVFLTHCQFEKNNYQNRFQMDEKWYTMSVGKKKELISQKKYVNYLKDWITIKRRLPYIKLDVFDDCINGNLAETNMRIIQKIRNRLDINTHLVEDKITESTGTERLIEICKYYGANEYISGPSGKDYMDLELFEAQGIKVTFQEKTASLPILKAI